MKTITANPAPALSRGNQPTTRAVVATAVVVASGNRVLLLQVATAVVVATTVQVADAHRQMDPEFFAPVVLNVSYFSDPNETCCVVHVHHINTSNTFSFFFQNSKYFSNIDHMIFLGIGFSYGVIFRPIILNVFYFSDRNETCCSFSLH